MDRDVADSAALTTRWKLSSDRTATQFSTPCFSNQPGTTQAHHPFAITSLSSGTIVGESWHFRAFSTRRPSLTIILTWANLLEVFRSQQLRWDFCAATFGAELSHKRYIRPGKPYYLSHLAGCAFSF